MRVACSVCGATGEDAELLAWTRDVDARDRVSWLCPDCTRDNVRAIEAKLDPEWW